MLSAALGGDPEIGRMLATRGAEIDAQDGITGFTPLMFATAYGHVSFVEFLLELGASPYIKGNDGSSISDMLSFSRNQAIADLLQKHMMDN